MGREIKHVALGFEWEQGKLWRGYVNPHPTGMVECVPCEGRGLSPKALFLEKTWYGHTAERMFGNFYGCNVVALWATREQFKSAGWGQDVIDNIWLAKELGFETLTFWGDKLNAEDIQWCYDNDNMSRDFFSYWDNDQKKVVDRDPKPPVPTPDEVNVGARGMFDTVVSQYSALKARCAMYGIHRQCEKCDGDGELVSDQSAVDLYESWKNYDPPAGPGLQMWSTTTEGHPMSPVFDTPEKLARWLADSGASSFGSNTSTYEQWLAFCRVGWAPSAVYSPKTGLISGVDAAGV